ncbi:MAG: hypothetical protein AAFX93_10620 [Verrucomicrobiota bacterium]
MKTAESAQEFLTFAADFQLGGLTTEQPHPITAQLSEACIDDLPQAIQLLKQVDIDAFAQLSTKMEPAEQLVSEIRTCWANGGRVFLAGCGATGRLSLALEVFCRDGLVPIELQENVIGFMAGGDAALIRSIEGFEDFPEYGAQQLKELDFRPVDLLIASTEGGETPWVIGATLAAAEISQQSPWFCYCNPDDELHQKVERSRRVLDNPGINKWNLAVGPMGIAGSTRMQASTVLQYAIGLALESAGQTTYQPMSIRQRVVDFASTLSGSDWKFLAEFIERESEIYEQDDHVLYVTDELGVSVLTDTTERSPTFSLPIFENYQQGSTNDPRSLCYLCLPNEPASHLAWKRLLRREPRCLDWPADLPVTRLQQLIGYDISSQAAHNRAVSCGEARHHCFAIDVVDDAIVWSLGRLAAEAVPSKLPFLESQMLLKMLLNTHSTILMGRMGRYEGNLMTYVKPSNNKLIDRAIRYIRMLFERKTGTTIDYDAVCHELFRQRELLAPAEPIVLKTLEQFLPKKPIDAG